MRRVILALLIVVLLLTVTSQVAAQEPSAAFEYPGIIPGYEWRPIPPADSIWWCVLEVTRGRTFTYWCPPVSPPHDCPYWDQDAGKFVVDCAVWQ